MIDCPLCLNSDLWPHSHNPNAAPLPHALLPEGRVRAAVLSTATRGPACRHLSWWWQWTCLWVGSVEGSVFFTCLWVGFIEGCMFGCFQGSQIPRKTAFFLLLFLTWNNLLSYNCSNPCIYYKQKSPDLYHRMCLKWKLEAAVSHSICVSLMSGCEVGC